MHNNTQHTVILDTNVINSNDSFTSFFGGNRIIENLKNNEAGIGSCQVVIPNMVIEELKRHKKDRLKQAIVDTKKSLKDIEHLKICTNVIHDDLNNQLNLYLEEDGINFKEQELNSLIDRLLEQESKNIKIIDFAKDKDLTQTHKDITKHVLDKLPPYKKKANNDSFKDIVIYYTILEQQYTQDDNVYFITNDDDFIPAFATHEHITILSSYKHLVTSILENRF